jgi:sugar (pentulose or hexulose) kinase
MEFGDASGTALLDPVSRRWSDEVLRLLGGDLEAWLPPLIPPGEPVGTLRRQVAEELGLPPGILVASGGGDNMMAAIGTGNTRPGVLTASLGTSGTLFAYARTPVIDPRGEVAGFCDSTGGWLPLVCTMNVTVCTGAVGELLGRGNVALTEEAARLTPGADGLLLLPFLQGERTPNLPGGKGVLFGLTEANLTPGHLYRAAMEGATLGLRYGLKRLAELGVTAREIRLTGGGSRNELWRQLVADIFELPVVRVAGDEGAAVGAALQAMWQHLRQSSPDLSCAEATGSLVAMDEETRCHPQSRSTATYRRLFSRWSDLLDAARTLF